MRDLRGVELLAESTKLLKIGGAIVAVAVFGVLAFYLYEQGKLYTPPKQIVTDQELPSPRPPEIPIRI